MRERCRWTVATLAGWMLAAPAHAAPAGLEEAIRASLAREVAAGTRLERVQFEFPDVPLPPALAGCLRAEPYLPAGTRLWGRTVIGVRCVEGSAGTARLPVVIRVHARALVATRPVPAGSVLTPADLGEAEVELTAGPGTVLTDPRQAIGRTLARPLATGAAVSPAHLRRALAVAPGDLVRVLYAGAGFTVSADGRALASAQEGQSVRVQTETGRVLTGVARPGRIVEIRAF